MARKLVLWLCALIVTWMIPVDAMAQIIDPFSTRYSSNHPGDIELIGNSILTCPTGVNSCDGVRDGTITTGGIANNNEHTMEYLDVDADPLTFNSSSALASLPASARVLWAGLYWGGRTESGVNGAAAPTASLRNQVLFRAPGAAAYSPVIASDCEEADPAGTGGVTGGIYQCFAEVTNSLPSALSGSLTVANIQTGTGRNRFGGWGVVIAYEDPAQQLRNLVVYDGFARVLDQGSGSVTINLSGFTSPANGDVVTRVGAIAYEGDAGAGGDSFRLDGTAISAGGDANNFFDAGIVDRGTNVTNRTPAYANNLGFDIKRAEVVNFLANTSSTAEIRLDTSGDNYFPGVVTFATALQAPELFVGKTAADVDGGEVTVGDEIEYTIVVRNDGGDGATDTSMTDVLPQGVTYVADSGRVNGSVVTDAAGDDVYTYDANTRSIEVNLGTGASAFQGGYVGPGASAEVSFRVTIDENLDQGDRIENQAVVQYVTETLNVPDTKISDGDQNTPGADTTVTVIESSPKFVSISSPLDGDMLLDRRPTIRGVSTPSARIELTLNNGQTVTVTADANGDWSYTPTVDLPLGPNNARATVVGDTATDDVDFTIIEEGVEISSPVPGTVTDDTTPTIDGKATPGSTVEILIDGDLVGTVIADADGDWSFTPQSPLSVGDHDVVARIPNTTASDTTDFIVTADRVDIMSPSAGETTSPTPTISGTAPPGAVVLLEVNGELISLTTDADGNWSYMIPADKALPTGPQTARATQGAATDTVTFNVTSDGGNGSDPEVDLVTPVAGSTMPNPPTFSGTSTPGAEVVITVDGVEIGRTTAGPDGTWSLTPDVELEPGAHDVTATVTIGDEIATDTSSFETPIDSGGTGNGDRDGDTIRDADDLCPDEAEDFDGVLDNDGCPDDDGKIARGGACSVASPAGSAGSPSLLLALLLPMLVGRIRRRATGALAALTALAAPATAQAQQDLTSFQVEHFEPLPSPTNNVMNVATSRTAKHLEFGFGLTAHYANDPLQFSNPDGTDAERAISDQLKAELSGNIGLFDILEIGLVLPFVLVQDGDDLRSFGRPGETISGGGVADFRVVPKVTILPNEKAAGFGVGIAAPMYIPVGDTGSFNSDGGFRVEPRLIVDFRTDFGLTVAANVGYQLLRGDQAVYNFNNDDILRWGVAARVPTPVERLAVAASLFGSASFQDANVIGDLDGSELDQSKPVELLGAVEYGFENGLLASLGGGAGVTTGVGSPDFRVLAGLGYAPVEQPEQELSPTPEPEPEPEPEPGDADGDGINDLDDSCPNEPEDFDAFRDEDGCPDVDDDDDGILDVDDRCRLEPEDKDGFKDEDGCPDPDNDGDGIMDEDDECPLEPELLNNIEDEDGCPEKDTDKDGIIDPLDKCPTEPETYNGKQDEDGCPDGKKTVVITKNEIKILRRVYFDTNKATIKKRSYGILDTVATVLKQNPQVKLVRIGGHTDDMGKDDYNLDLSDRRAAAVRSYLIGKGIDESRLVSQGYGEDVPLCRDIPEKMLGKRSRKKAIKECRAENRRVEFKILKIEGSGTTIEDTE